MTNTATIAPRALYQEVAERLRQQIFAGEATRLAYGTAEAAEGRDSFLEKRDADWSAFPWHY